jgi:hypothetical protein
MNFLDMRRYRRAIVVVRKFRLAPLRPRFFQYPSVSPKHHFVLVGTEELYPWRCLLCVVGTKLFDDVKVIRHEQRLAVATTRIPRGT